MRCGWVDWTLGLRGEDRDVLGFPGYTPAMNIRISADVQLSSPRVHSRHCPDRGRAGGGASSRDLKISHGMVKPTGASALWK